MEGAYEFHSLFEKLMFVMEIVSNSMNDQLCWDLKKFQTLVYLECVNNIRNQNCWANINSELSCHEGIDDQQI